MMERERRWSRVSKMGLRRDGEGPPRVPEHDARTKLYVGRAWTFAMSAYGVRRERESTFRERASRTPQLA